MPMLAEMVDAVIGVDTHLDSHALAVCAPSGAVLAQATIAADAGGYAAAVAFAAAHAPGPRVSFAVEGSRSHGIGLARALAAAGQQVVEVERPKRAARRGKGKSDAIDAVLAARAALGYHLDRLPTPRADGDREALRILLAARRDATDERTAKVNALRALLRGGDHADAALARGRLSPARLAAIARRRGRAGHTREQATRLAEARRLALRITDLDRELAANTKTLTAIVDELVPGLLDRHGIGPVSAAQAIVSYSHHGRCRNDAAYARLGGAAPLEASSGKTVRHRLNRGGDRDLNRALHDIAKTRMRSCPRTRAYVERRRADGKTDREIRRCLKRYIARELFRALNHAKALDNT
jgi:transposase